MSLREKICLHIWKKANFSNSKHTHVCSVCHERRNEADLAKQYICYHCGYEIRPSLPHYAVRYTEKPKGSPDRWHTIGITCEVCEGRHGSYIDNSAPVEKEIKDAKVD